MTETQSDFVPQQSNATSSVIDVVVSGCRKIGRVKIFNISCEDGQDLPEYDPGSHVAIIIPEIGPRCYSIASWPVGDRSRYRLAVSLASDSKGGSVYIHEHVEDGAKLKIRSPLNFFRMAALQKRAVFVAGGIGITPIKSMIDHCEAVGMRWRLAYFCRSVDDALFVDELAATQHGAVDYHFGTDAETNAAILSEFAGERRLGEHLYCCGPAGLMDLVADIARKWPKETLHFERFTQPAEVPADGRPFDVVLSRSNLTLHVPANKSILEVLEENGVAPMWSCRSGLCGACAVTVLAGEIEHHDEFLTPAERERQDCLMTCVSRSCGETLWLDL